MAKVLLDKEAKTKSYCFSVMVNGVRVKRRGFKTKKEGEAALAEIVDQLSKGEFIEPSKMTFGSYFKEWLENRQNITNTTRKMYDSYFRTHIDPALGKIPLSKLSPLDIQKFVKKLRDKGLSDEMVKRVYSTVNASLNTAVKMEIVSKNVADKIEKPTVKREERAIWSNDSIKEFLIKTKGETRYWIAVFLAVMTGMRQGEILGLKWTDIDFEKNVLYVRRNLVKDKSGFSDLKTEKSRRTIRLSPLTVKALKEQQLKVSLEKEQLGNKYEDNDLVVCTSKGTPAKATRVLHAWNRLCAKFKPEHEPRMTFHDLRHQSASIMLNDGIDIRIVSQRLGHSNVSTTLNIYSHLLPDAQEDAALSLDKSIGFNFGDEE